MSETAPNKTMLSIRNLETFYGPVMAIRGVSLDVMQGQIVYSYPMALAKQLC